MQKPEIIGGLKTAIERGSSLEQAKNSFKNAGYNPQDVEDSAANLDFGVLSMHQNSAKTQEDSALPLSTPSAPQGNIPSKPLPTMALIQKKSSKGTIIIILLSVILILLLGSLLGMIFAKDLFLSLLSKIGINI